MSNFDRVVYNSVMEFANHWRAQESIRDQSEIRVRVAVDADSGAVTRLLRSAGGSHVHVDWRLPIEWLGSPHFVVVPQSLEETGARYSKFFALPERLSGCLAATADPLPAAWVRVAAVAREAESLAMLGAMLDRVVGSLRDTAVTQLAWLVAQDWPNPYLPAFGFEQINQIETYVKYDLDVPQFHQAPDLIIRPVQPRDFAALAEIETIAFEPLWRMSSDTLALAQRDALCFDVAVWNGRVVGYQLCSYGANSAHLVRLTIAPQAQGQGVGSALLAQAIRMAAHDSLRYISLNTQVDNSTSQHLYKKFGFLPIGERLPVWSKTI